MAEAITIANATIVQGTTSVESFLACKINNKNIGLPAYQFSMTTPNIDLLPPTSGLTFPEFTTIYNTSAGTPYGVGLALTVNNSALAIPLFKIQQDEYDFPNIMFETPMLVTNLTSLSEYLITFIDDADNTTYGLPLYRYGDLYQAIPPSGVPLSAMGVSTVIRTGKPINDVVKGAGSTHLNPKIVAYSDLIIRVKKLLGWPSINIDLCDENIAEYIDTAMEFYTKFTGYTEEFLVFNTKIYIRGYGIKLDTIFSCTPETRTTETAGASAIYDYDLKDYRKVIDCHSLEQGEGTGVNTLFTMEQAMAQQTYFSYMLGNAGFDLVTWDILKGWMETRTKVLAQTPYYRFDPRTQIFRILPEPFIGQQYMGVIGCYVEKPIRDLISEMWIIQYTLALTKIAVGQIRGKFGGMVLFGGGVLNANDVLTQGLAEKDKLEQQMFTGQGISDVYPAKFFMG